MNSWILIVFFLIILIIPIIAGIPVAYSIGITSLAILVLPVGPSFNLDIISVQMLRGSDDFVLLSIPLYLFAGRLLSGCGSTEAIFEFSRAVMRPIKGGIAYVNVLASLIFSGMSGSAVADVAGIGVVEYEMMERADFESTFATSIIGASATIGPVFPPSIAFIIYGVLAGVSIGTLFISGIAPGILMALALATAIFFYVRRLDRESGGDWDFKEILRTFVRASPALFTIVLIVGGITSGFFTATESGAVAIVWVLLIGSVYYDGLDIYEIWNIASRSATEVGSLLLIVASASIYSFTVTAANIPDLMVSSLTALGLGGTGNLFLLVIGLLLLGTVIEPLSVMVLVIPIVAPEFATLGIDPVHAGVVVTLTLMIGLITPPVGVILFILEQISDSTFEEISVAIIPFYIPLLMVLTLLILLPGLATFLPNMLL